MEISSCQTGTLDVMALGLNQMKIMQQAASIIGHADGYQNSRAKRAENNLE